MLTKKFINTIQTVIFLQEGVPEGKLILEYNLAPYINDAKEIIKFMEEKEIIK